MSFSLFSPQKCLFIDSVLQEVSLVCISEPSVRRTVLQLCKVVVGSGNLALLENLCCSLLQSYLLVSLIKKITIRIFNLRSWGQDVFFFFFLNVIPKKAENSFCFLEIKVLFCFFTVQWQWRCTIHLYCINATWRFVSTLSYHLRSFLVHHCFILSN